MSKKGGKTQWESLAQKTLYGAPYVENRLYHPILEIIYVVMNAGIYGI